MAEENLKLAKLELAQNFARGAISKAYYVFLDMARASLLSKGIITRSHRYSISKFGEVFIKSGQISKDYGRWFNRALRARQEADYEALKSFTIDEAKKVVEEAEKFYNELKKIIPA